MKKKRIPWNKGLKGYTNKGSFKKGHIPTSTGTTYFKKNHKINVGRKKSTETIEKLKLHSYWKDKHLPENIREKLSETKRGEKHWNWKGGITASNAKMRNNNQLKEWRRKVYERDHFTCIQCGNNEGHNLEADHIKSFALYPELRYKLNNGRTLCHECHLKTPTYAGRKYCPSYI